MRPTYWVPAVIWMGVILILASDSGSSARTGRSLLPLLQFFMPDASMIQLEALHGAARKAAHVTEYAILTGLWLRAWLRGAGVSRPTATWRALAIAVGWAIVDESYQSTLLSRTGTPYDVGIDALGILAVIIPTALGWRATADWLTRAGLWVAIVGGSVLLVVNLTIGVTGWVLWLTVPAAVLALVLSRRPPTP